METVIEGANLAALETRLNAAMMEEDWYMQGEIYVQGGLFKLRLFRLPPSVVETALLALDEPPESPEFLPHLTSLLVSAARAPLRLPAIAKDAAARLGGLERLRGGDFDVFVPLFESLTGAARNPRDLARISVMMDYFSEDDPTFWEYAHEKWDALARGLDMTDEVAAARQWLRDVVRPADPGLAQAKIDEVRPAVEAVQAAAKTVQETADAAVQFSAFEGKMANVRNQLLDPKVKIYKNTVDVEGRTRNLEAISAAILRILEEAKAAALEKQKADLTVKNQATRIQRAAKRSLEARKGAPPLDELAAAAQDNAAAEEAKAEAQRQVFTDMITAAQEQAAAIGAAKGAVERVASGAEQGVRAAEREARAAAEAQAAEAQRAAATEALTASALEVAAAAAKLEGNETAVKEAAAEAKQAEAEEAEEAEKQAKHDAVGAEDDVSAYNEQLVENLAQANQTAEEAMEAKATAEAQAGAVAEAKTQETLQLADALAANEAEAKEAERDAQTAAEAKEAEAARAAEAKNAEDAAAAEAERLQLELAANEEAAKQEAHQTKAVEDAQAGIKQVERDALALYKILQEVRGRSNYAAKEVISNEQAAEQKRKEAEIKNGWKEAARKVELDAATEKKAADAAQAAAQQAAIRQKELEKTTWTEIQKVKNSARLIGSSLNKIKSVSQDANEAALPVEAELAANDASEGSAQPDLNERLFDFLISANTIQTILLILGYDDPKIKKARDTAFKSMDAEPESIQFIKDRALHRNEALLTRTIAILHAEVPEETLSSIRSAIQALERAATLDDIEKSENMIAERIAHTVRDLGSESEMDRLAKDYYMNWVLANRDILESLEPKSATEERVADDAAYATEERVADDAAYATEERVADDAAYASEGEPRETTAVARTAEERDRLERFYALNPSEIYVTGEGVEGVYTRSTPYQGVGDPLVLTYTQEHDRNITINMVKAGDKYTFKIQNGDKEYPTNVQSDAVSVLDIQSFKKPGMLFETTVPVAIYDDSEEKHPVEIVLTSETPEFNGLFQKNGNLYEGPDGLQIHLSKINGQMQYTVAGFIPIAQLFGEVSFVDQQNQQAEVKIQTVPEAMDEAMRAADLQVQEAERNAGAMGAIQAAVGQISAEAQEKAGEFTRAAAEAKAAAEAEASSAAENAVREGQRNSAELNEKQMSVQQVGADARAAFEAKVRAADAAEKEASAKARAAALVVAEKRNKDAMGQATASTAGFAVSRVEAAAAEVANQAGLAAELNHQAGEAAQMQANAEVAAHFADRETGRKNVAEVDLPERTPKNAKRDADVKLERDAMTSAASQIKAVLKQQNAIAGVVAKVEETTAEAAAAAMEAAAREAQRSAELAADAAAQLQQELGRIKEVERKANAVRRKKEVVQRLTMISPLVVLSNIPGINGLYAEALDEDYPVLYKTADGRPIVHTNPTVQIGPFAVESHKFTGNLLGRYEEKGSRVTVARFLHRLQLTSASAPNINGVYDSADGLLYTRTDNPAFSLKYEPTDDRFHFTTPRNVYISDQRAGDSSRPDETTFYPAFGDTFTPKNASYVQGKFVEDPPINIRFQMATDDPTASEPVAAAAYPSSNTFTLTPAGEEIPFFSKIKGTGTKNMVDVIVGNYTKTQTGYMKNPAAIPVQFTQSGDRFTAVVSLEGTFGKPYRVTYTFVPADDMTQLGVQWTEGGQLKDKTTQIKFSS